MLIGSTRADDEEGDEREDRYPFRSHDGPPGAAAPVVDVTAVTLWLSGLANRTMGQLSIDLSHVRHRLPRFPDRSCAPGSTSRSPSRSPRWIAENGLRAGDRLPPERELATRLGVSRATLSQALVALEVIGVVAVRHGDGTVLTDKPGPARIIDAIRAHADRLPEIIETRDALETKLAALAAARRTDEDLARIDAALDEMERDIEAGGRGVEGDERFHGAVTAAAHSRCWPG